MMDVVFAAKAQRDVEEIVRTISKANHAAAERVANAIFASCETLSQFPLRPLLLMSPASAAARLVHFPYAIFFASTRIAMLSRSCTSSMVAALAISDEFQIDQGQPITQAGHRHL